MYQRQKFGMLEMSVWMSHIDCRYLMACVRYHSSTHCTMTINIISSICTLKCCTGEEFQMDFDNLEAWRNVWQQPHHW